MSERDDDYLWSGEGSASDQLVKLEKRLGGEKLHEPLRARRRRPLLLALAVAALTTAATLALIRDAAPSPGWTAAVLPGVSADEIQGAVLELELIDPDPPDGWQAAVEQRIREIATPTGVRFTGRKVVVDVARGVPDLASALGRRREFAIKEVIESSPIMRALYTRVSEGDARAAELGVTAEIDYWEHDETGRRFNDWYLTAPTGDALRTYLAEVGAADPRLAPDAGHEIAIEPLRANGSDEPPGWRTYYLDRVVWLSNADIASAFVYWNDVTGRPEVMVEFTREGGMRFSDLTARIAGRKLAILLDGQVSSAPVVVERISGGRTSVIMGSGTAAELQADAHALVEALRSSRHPLPVALRLVDVKVRSEQLSDRQRRAARLVIAVLFGLVVFAAVFAAERRSPAVDPEVAPVRGRPRRRSLPWLRLAITAGGVTIALLLERIPIPGDVDWSAVGSSPISMFTLGIMPALSAYLLVELAALIVPRWRRLQAGGPSLRARLGSATAILTIVLAAVQAWFIADFLISIPPLATLSRGMVVLSLTGGAVAITTLALLIGQYGLGNGFAMLLLGGFASQIHRVVHAFPSLESDGIAVWAFEGFIAVIGAALATAIATSWILRHRVRGPSPASSVRLPTAGLVPMTALPALLVLFALTWPEAAARIGVWWEESVARPGAGLLVELGFLAVLTAALSWLFSRPSRLGGAQLATSAAGMWRTFAVATALSTGYLVLFALLGRWTHGELGYFGLTLLPVAFGTAILMDLLAEWRAFARRDDLVPVWPLHKVQRVDLVTVALVKNGIDVHTRGLYLRLLLHFFGPFVPVLVYVPREQVEEARAIIAAQLEAT